MPEDRLSQAATVVSRVIGWIVAIAGIFFALGGGGFGAIIMLGYWNYEGAEGRTVLALSVLLAFVIGYGIYRLGRHIAR
jgi:hypothetical protein